MFVICIHGVSFVTPYFGTTEQHTFHVHVEYSDIASC